MNKHLRILVLLTILSNHLVRPQGINFPDSPNPAPASADSNVPGLEGRQATTLTTLPGFPTIANTPVVNIVTTGQTCICVPTGTCTPGTGSGDGTELIDIRIVNNPITGTTIPGVTVPGVTTLPVVTGIPGVTIPTNAYATTCAAGLVQCCQTGPYQCGVRYPPVASAPAPAAGQAPYGSYPWQAVLLGQGDVYLGSGALLNNVNVLTVAHKAQQYVSNPTAIRVRLGEWNAGGATEPIPAQEFLVSKIFIHPSYNAGNLKNDIAILRLATGVPLGNNPAITTGCLPSTSFVGTRCFVSGWGRNDFVSGSYQAIQKQVDVPILQPTQCQSQLAATRLGPTFLFDTTSFICAGGENGKDACTGDGGSPLVCTIGNRWFVAGLVAWGIGCGTTNVPGVYVNVASYVPWIQTTVNTL